MVNLVKIFRNFRPWPQWRLAQSDRLHAKETGLRAGERVIVLAFASLLYLNGLGGDFTYDDNRAIKSNPDLMSSTPWYRLFQNDFWGTPIRSSNSHGSYRPLTVFTFRLNFFMHELNPFGFHVFNLALHLIVIFLYMRFISYVLQGHRRITLISSMLFASHPIHVESVTSIVGRADVGAAFFYLLALLSYAKFAKYDQRSGTPVPITILNMTDHRNHRRKRYLYASLTFATMSMLAKEHGVTCLAVCAVYHLFVIHRFSPFSLQNYRILLNEPNLARLRSGLLHLIVTGHALVIARCLLMFSAPIFSTADNPASNNSSATIRFFTFIYLPVFNFFLLLHPRSLSFDWSMDSIPLIASAFDTRNIHSFLFYISLFALVRKITKFYSKQFIASAAPSSTTEPHQHRHIKITKMPKPSNKHHWTEDIDNNNNNSSSINYNYVGMNQNRVDLMMQQQQQQQQKQQILDIFTDNNNNDEMMPNQNLIFNNCIEQNEYGAKKANYTTCPTPTSNLPLSSTTLSSMPLQSPPITRVVLCKLDCLALALALMIIPFLPVSNLFFYVGFVVAERILYIPSFGYCLFLAIGIESLLQFLRYRSPISRRKILVYPCVVAVVTMFAARTVLRNFDWLSEENLYRSGIPVNPAKAFGNLANILNAQGKVHEAERAYRKALEYRGNMADVHYNLGLLLQEQGRLAEALESYHKAIQFRPRLALAHLNAAIVLSQLGQRDQAKSVYRHCAQIDGTGLKDIRQHETTKISALYNLGRLFAEEENFEKALQIFHEAISRMPHYYPSQSLFNVIGEMYYKLGQNHEAERWFVKSLRTKRDHIPAHLTYAKLLITLNRTQEAEQLYQKAIMIAPNDTVIYRHYGQLIYNSGRFELALELYQKGLSISPHNFDLVINMANTLRELKKNKQAEKYYQLAATIRPNDAISWSNLGAIRHVNGKYQLAMESYLQALQLKPDDSITKTNIAKLKQTMAMRTI